MKAIETINYKNHIIDILYDEYCESPDQWENEDTFLVYDHSDFYVERDGFNPSDIWNHIQETKKWFYDGYYVFPVYAYIHSSVSLSMENNSYPFTCPWDTSMQGFVLVKRLKNWSYTKNKAAKIAESLVKEWDSYCRGEVYGYSIDNGDGDSCWGYIGDINYPIEEAKNVINYMITEEIKNHFTQLKTWIKNKVPFSNRYPLSV